MCLCRWWFPHRPNADALSEAVVCLNVVIELLHRLPSQVRAVMGLIHIQYHWKTAWKVHLHSGIGRLRCETQSVVLAENITNSMQC